MTTTDSLAVLGAGPKALAITAKRKVLSDLGWSVPQLFIVEKDKVAAHWLGDYGYTDGEQPLGTPPFKDVGFPYHSTCWDDDNLKVNMAMSAFSWQSFLIESEQFARWIDRGRPAPNHSRWAQYLQWVADKIELDITFGAVTQIGLNGRRWRLDFTEADEACIECDGLVITGPGDPIPIPGRQEDHPLILNGRTFWNKIGDFVGRNRMVAVVGSGETAASVAATLHRVLDGSSQIDIINTEGAMYSRGESFDENRRFTHPGDWKTLTEGHRREFVKRTDRGVFSLQAKAVLDRAENVESRKGKVINVIPLDLKVKLEIQYDQETENHVYDYLIWATGFDPSCFKALLTDDAKEKVHNEVGSWSKDDIERRVERDLSIERVRPRLHLPMFASLRQGPGFPNLSALGHLSDRILATYAKRLDERNGGLIAREITLA